MRNFLIFVYIPIVASLYISCSSNQFADKIQTLDSLSFEVEKLIDSIKIVDTIIYKNAASEIEKNITLIKNQLKDTVTQEEARTLSDYKMIRKSLDNFPEKIKALHKELLYTQTQINNLSKDLKMGYIEASKAEEYFSIEVASAQAVLDDGWNTLNNSPVYLKMFDGLQPKVEEFLKKHQINDKE